MADEIARGEIHVEVNDREALASLRRIDDEFERTMRDIDRQSADVEIRAKTDKLKKDVAEANALLKKAAADRADAETTAEKRSTATALTHAKKRAAGRQAELDAHLKILGAHKEEGKALALTEKRVKAIEKAEASRQRAFEAADRRRQAAARAEQRDIEKTQRLREREAVAMERIRTKAARDAERAEQARARELAAIPKMQRRYAELAQSIDRLNVAKRKVKRDERASLVVDLKIKEAVAEMAALHETLERVGSPVDIDVNLHPGRDFGARMRKTIHDGMRQGGLRTAARDAGILTGVAFTAGVADVMRRNLAPKKLLGGVTGVLGRIGHALGNLSEMTVRLGPFTATIRQAFVGLSLLAPIILDVVGALGALVGVVGSATVGLAALSLGFLGGAIPAMAGMAFVIKDVVQEFKAVKKAQKAYDDAVMKGNTDLAAKKLKELKATMGNVSDETVKQVGLAQKLGGQWDKLTKPAHAAVWTAIGEGLQTVNDLMPMFARNTNKAMGVAEKSTSRWMEALRSPEGKSIIDNMMGNFTESLGPLLDGLGNIAAYLGRVASLASNRMPGVMATFEAWSERILGTSDDMGALDDRIGKVIQSAKDLGNWFMASGRLMKAFFGGGVDAGQSFTNTMTDAMNRWTAFLNTAQGRKSLGQFFDEAVAGAQSLWAVLAPITVSFVRWAANIAPFARAFFDAAGAVAQFVSELLKATGLRTPLLALATTLGALWSIGKIGAATRAIQGFATGLFGLSRAGAAVRTAQVASTAATIATTAAVARSTATLSAAERVALAAGATSTVAASGVSKLGRAGGVAKAGLTGLGGLVTGVASPVAGLAVVTVAAAGGMYLWANRTREWEKQAETAEGATRNFRAIIEQLADGNVGLAGTSLQAQQAQADYNATARQARQEQRLLNAMVKEGTKGTREYKDLQAQHRQTVLSLRSARLNDLAAAQAVKTAYKAETDAVQETLNTAKQAAEARQKQVDDLSKNQVAEDYERQAAAAKKAGQSVEDYIEDHAQFGHAKDTLLEYGRALAALESANNDVSEAQQVAILQTLNQKRAMQGLYPIAQRAAKLFASLQAQGGKSLATKISLKYDDPGKARNVAAAANRALQSGVKPARVRFIVENAKGAADAIRQINSIEITPKRLKIIEEGGENAIRMVQRIVGHKLSPKTQRIIEKGGAGALGMLARLTGRLLPAKTQKVKGDDSQARNVLDRVNNAVVKTLIQYISRNLKNTGNEFPAPNPVTQLVYRKRAGSLATGGSDGVGGAATPGTQRAQDRAASRGMRGLLPATSTGAAQRGMKVSGPRAIYGEEPQHPEFVITSNPSYRKSNLGYLRQAAASLGISMAASGQTAEEKAAALLKKPLTDKGKGKARKQARSRLKGTRPTHYKSDNLVELANVEKAKRSEDNFRDVVQREADQLDAREPSTFLKETGKDADGNKTYAIDEQVVWAWNDQLTRMAERFQQLVQKVQETLVAVKTAMERIGNPYGKAGKGSVIAKADANMETIQKLIDKDQSIATNSKSRKARDAARERISVYREALSNEKETKANATADWKTLDSERNDIGNEKRGRLAEARDAAFAYSGDAVSVIGKATADAIAANPEAPTEGTSAANTPDMEAQLAQANQRATVAASGQSIAESALAAFTSAGDIGSANYASAYTAAIGRPSSSSYAAVSGGAGAVDALTGRARASQPSATEGAWQTVSGSPVLDAREGASGGATVINIHTLHPGDPATLRAIGDAATAGLSFQGSQESPRARIGY